MDQNNQDMMHNGAPQPDNDPDHDAVDPQDRKGLVAWFVNNHVAANIFMIFLVVSGFIVVSNMITEIFPSIDPKIITVTVPYPGATPKDVEDGITRRVEEALIGIDGVDRVVSNASEGVGTVTAELDDFVDVDQVLTDIETAIDRLTSFPPERAEQVTIVKAKATSAVLTVVVHGDVNELALRDWAETVKDDIIQLPDVSLVDLSGTRDREISIEISEDTLRRYGLTLNDVATAVSRFSTDIPAGVLKAEGSEILIRVQERRYTGNEFNNIVVRSKTDGSLLRLNDIATIEDGFTDNQLINNFNGESAIFIDVTRSDSEDTLTIENEIRDYINTLELPGNIHVTVWNNQTDALRDRINLLTRNAIIGYALVFTALLMFLDLKLAFWTSLSIPISFMGGLMMASLLGVSMNMITLFALIVVLGIVVDDAIVMGESIFSKQEDGLTDSDAVLAGVNSIRAPVTIGVLTTIAAFAPLMFSTGILGQILRPIPIVVTGILLTSLLEAFFILPSHLYKSNRWSRGALAQLRRIVTRGLDGFIARIITPFLRVCVGMRYVTIIVCVIFFVGAIGLVKSGTVRFIFFPPIEGDEISASIEMPVGTPFAVTQQYTEDLYTAALKTQDKYQNQYGHNAPLFKNISVTVGSIAGDDGPGGGGGASQATHLSQVLIELVPSDDRQWGSGTVEREWQSNLDEIPGAKKIAFESSLIGGGDDINVELSHRDADVLRAAAEQLKRQLRDVDGVSEVIDSAELGKREFVYELTSAGIAAGLTPADIGNQLRTAFYGTEVDRIQRGTNEVKVMVRYPDDERETLSILDRIRVQLPTGGSANINAMATIREQRSPSIIKRVNGRRVVTVTGDVNEATQTPNDVLAKIDNNMMPDIMDRYSGLSYSFEGQSRDQAQDLKTLGKNMGIAMMIIFVMLAGQLRSYVKPFIILMTVPVGVAGAIYGHFLLGFDLSFLSLFGIVALSGVVINDSVVLVDYFNKLIDRGVDINDAVIKAVQRRFRPILLTTLTTSLGLLPMLLETSLQAQFIIPMAVSLACGIVFASAILIIMIPCLLMIFDDVYRVKDRISAGINDNPSS